MIPFRAEPLPPRKRLCHTPPPWVKSGDLFFVTICCAGRKTNSLAHAQTLGAIATALEHYVAANKLWAHLLVLAMPDHLHALLAFPADQRTEKILRDGKRYVARQTGIVWQDGFFDHRLRHDESIEEKAHSIRLNPVHAGLVANPTDWPYVWPGRAGYP